MAFEDINWQLLAPVIVIQLILMVVALIDLSRREQTRGPKLMWVAIIIIGSLLGSILYFVVGRKNDE